MSDRQVLEDFGRFHVPAASDGGSQIRLEYDGSNLYIANRFDYAKNPPEALPDKDLGYVGPGIDSAEAQDHFNKTVVPRVEQAYGSELSREDGQIKHGQPSTAETGDSADGDDTSKDDGGGTDGEDTNTDDGGDGTGADGEEKDTSANEGEGGDKDAADADDTTSTDDTEQQSTTEDAVDNKLTQAIEDVETGDISVPEFAKIVLNLLGDDEGPATTVNPTPGTEAGTGVDGNGQTADAANERTADLKTLGEYLDLDDKQLTAITNGLANANEDLRAQVYAIIDEYAVKKGLDTGLLGNPTLTTAQSATDAEKFEQLKTIIETANQLVAQAQSQLGGMYGGAAPGGFTAAPGGFTGGGGGFSGGGGGGYSGGGGGFAGGGGGDPFAAGGGDPFAGGGGSGGGMGGGGMSGDPLTGLLQQIPQLLNGVLGGGGGMGGGGMGGGGMGGGDMFGGGSPSGDVNSAMNDPLGQLGPAFQDRFGNQTSGGGDGGVIDPEAFDPTNQGGTGGSNGGDSATTGDSSSGGTTNTETSTDDSSGDMSAGDTSTTTDGGGGGKGDTATDDTAATDTGSDSSTGTDEGTSNESGGDEGGDAPAGDTSNGDDAGDDDSTTSTDGEIKLPDGTTVEAPSPEAATAVNNALEGGLPGDAATAAYDGTNIPAAGPDGQRGDKVDPADVQPGDVACLGDKTMIVAKPGFVIDGEGQLVPFEKALGDGSGFTEFRRWTEEYNASLAPAPEVDEQPVEQPVEEPVEEPTPTENPTATEDPTTIPENPETPETGEATPETPDDQVLTEGDPTIPSSDNPALAASK